MRNSAFNSGKTFNEHDFSASESSDSDNSSDNLNDSDSNSDDDSDSLNSLNDSEISGNTNNSESSDSSLESRIDEEDSDDLIDFSDDESFRKKHQGRQSQYSQYQNYGSSQSGQKSKQRSQQILKIQKGAKLKGSQSYYNQSLRARPQQSQNQEKSKQSNVMSISMSFNSLMKQSLGLGPQPGVMDLNQQNIKKPGFKKSSRSSIGGRISENHFQGVRGSILSKAFPNNNEQSNQNQIQKRVTQQQQQSVSFAVQENLKKNFQQNDNDNLNDNKKIASPLLIVDADGDGYKTSKLKSKMDKDLQVFRMKSQGVNSKSYQGYNTVVNSDTRATWNANGNHSLTRMSILKTGIESGSGSSPSRVRPSISLNTRAQQGPSRPSMTQNLQFQQSPVSRRSLSMNRGSTAPNYLENQDKRQSLKPQSQKKKDGDATDDDKFKLKFGKDGYSIATNHAVYRAGVLQKIRANALAYSVLLLEAPELLELGRKEGDVDHNRLFDSTNNNNNNADLNQIQSSVNNSDATATNRSEDKDLNKIYLKIFQSGTFLKSELLQLEKITKIRRQSLVKSSNAGPDLATLGERRQKERMYIRQNERQEQRRRRREEEEQELIKKLQAKRNAQFNSGPRFNDKDSVFSNALGSQLQNDNNYMGQRRSARFGENYLSQEESKQWFTLRRESIVNPESAPTMGDLHENLLNDVNSRGYKVQISNSNCANKDSSKSNVNNDTRKSLNQSPKTRKSSNKRNSLSLRLSSSSGQCAKTDAEIQIENELKAKSDITGSIVASEQDWKARRGSAIFSKIDDESLPVLQSSKVGRPTQLQGQSPRSGGSSRRTESGSGSPSNRSTNSTSFKKKSTSFQNSTNNLNFSNLSEVADHSDHKRQHKSEWQSQTNHHGSDSKNSVATLFDKLAKRIDSERTFAEDFTIVQQRLLMLFRDWEQTQNEYHINTVPLQTTSESKIITEFIESCWRQTQEMLEKSALNPWIKAEAESKLRQHEDLVQTRLALFEEKLHSNWEKIMEKREEQDRVRKEEEQERKAKEEEEIRKKEEQKSQVNNMSNLKGKNEHLTAYEKFYKGAEKASDSLQDTLKSQNATDAEVLKHLESIAKVDIQIDSKGPNANLNKNTASNESDVNSQQSKKMIQLSRAEARRKRLEQALGTEFVEQYERDQKASEESAAALVSERDQYFGSASSNRKKKDTNDQQGQQQEGNGTNNQSTQQQQSSSNNNDISSNLFDQDDYLELGQPSANDNLGNQLFKSSNVHQSDPHFQQLKKLWITNGIKKQQLEQDLMARNNSVTDTKQKLQDKISDSMIHVFADKMHMKLQVMKREKLSLEEAIDNLTMPVQDELTFWKRSKFNIKLAKRLHKEKQKSKIRTKKTQETSQNARIRFEAVKMSIQACAEEFNNLLSGEVCKLDMDMLEVEIDQELIQLKIEEMLKTTRKKKREKERKNRPKTEAQILKEDEIYRARNHCENLTAQLRKLDMMRKTEETKAKQAESDLRRIDARIGFTKRKVELTGENEQLKEDCFVLEERWNKILKKMKRKKKRIPTYLQQKDPDEGLDSLTREMNRAKRKNAKLRKRREAVYARLRKIIYQMGFRKMAATMQKPPELECKFVQRMIRMRGQLNAKLKSVTGYCNFWRSRIKQRKREEKAERERRRLLGLSDHDEDINCDGSSPGNQSGPYGKGGMNQKSRQYVKMNQVNVMNFAEGSFLRFGGSGGGGGQIGGVGGIYGSDGKIHRTLFGSEGPGGAGGGLDGQSAEAKGLNNNMFGFLSSRNRQWMKRRVPYSMRNFVTDVQKKHAGLLQGSKSSKKKKKNKSKWMKGSRKLRQAEREERRRLGLTSDSGDYGDDDSDRSGSNDSDDSDSDGDGNDQSGSGQKDKSLIGGRRKTHVSISQFELDMNKFKNGLTSVDGSGISGSKKRDNYNRLSSYGGKDPQNQDDIEHDSDDEREFSQFVGHMMNEKKSLARTKAEKNKNILIVMKEASQLRRKFREVKKRRASYEKELLERIKFWDSLLGQRMVFEEDISEVLNYNTGLFIDNSSSMALGSSKSITDSQMFNNNSVGVQSRLSSRNSRMQFSNMSIRQQELHQLKSTILVPHTEAKRKNLILKHLQERQGTSYATLFVSHLLLELVRCAGEVSSGKKRRKKEAAALNSSNADQTDSDNLTQSNNLGSSRSIGRQSQNSININNPDGNNSPNSNTQQQQGFNTSSPFASNSHTANIAAHQCLNLLKQLCEQVRRDVVPDVSMKDLLNDDDEVSDLIEKTELPGWIFSRNLIKTVNKQREWEEEQERQGNKIERMPMQQISQNNYNSGHSSDTEVVTVTPVSTNLVLQRAKSITSSDFTGIGLERLQEEHNHSNSGGGPGRPVQHVTALKLQLPNLLKSDGDNSNTDDKSQSTNQGQSQTQQNTAMNKRKSVSLAVASIQGSGSDGKDDLDSDINLNENLSSKSLNSPNSILEQSVSPPKKRASVVSFNNQNLMNNQTQSWNTKSSVTRAGRLNSPVSEGEEEITLVRSGMNSPLPTSSNKILEDSVDIVIESNSNTNNNLTQQRQYYQGNTGQSQNQNQANNINMNSRNTNKKNQKGPLPIPVSKSGVQREDIYGTKLVFSKSDDEAMEASATDLKKLESRKKLLNRHQERKKMVEGANKLSKNYLVDIHSSGGDTHTISQFFRLLEDILGFGQGTASDQWWLFSARRRKFKGLGTKFLATNLNVQDRELLHCLLSDALVFNRTYWSSRLAEEGFDNGNGYGSGLLTDTEMSIASDASRSKQQQQQQQQLAILIDPGKMEIQNHADERRKSIHQTRGLARRNTMLLFGSKQAMESSQQDEKNGNDATGFGNSTNLMSNNSTTSFKLGQNQNTRYNYNRIQYSSSRPSSTMSSGRSPNTMNHSALLPPSSSLASGLATSRALRERNRRMHLLNSFNSLNRSKTGMNLQKSLSDTDNITSYANVLGSRERDRKAGAKHLLKLFMEDMQNCSTWGDDEAENLGGAGSGLTGRRSTRTSLSSRISASQGMENGRRRSILVSTSQRIMKGMRRSVSESSTVGRMANISDLEELENNHDQDLIVHDSDADHQQQFQSMTLPNLPKDRSRRSSIILNSNATDSENLKDNSNYNNMRRRKSEVRFAMNDINEDDYDQELDEINMEDNLNHQKHDIDREDDENIMRPTDSKRPSGVDVIGISENIENEFGNNFSQYGEFGPPQNHNGLDFDNTSDIPIVPWNDQSQQTIDSSHREPQSQWKSEINEIEMDKSDKQQFFQDLTQILSDEEIRQIQPELDAVENDAQGCLKVLQRVFRLSDDEAQILERYVEGGGNVDDKDLEMVLESIITRRKELGIRNELKCNEQQSKSLTAMSGPNSNAQQQQSQQGTNNNSNLRRFGSFITNNSKMNAGQNHGRRLTSRSSRIGLDFEDMGTMIKGKSAGQQLLQSLPSVADANGNQFTNSSQKLTNLNNNSIWHLDVQDSTNTSDLNQIRFKSKSNSKVKSSHNLSNNHNAKFYRINESEHQKNDQKPRRPLMMKWGKRQDIQEPVKTNNNFQRWARKTEKMITETVTETESTQQQSQKNHNDDGTGSTYTSGRKKSVTMLPKKLPHPSQYNDNSNVNRRSIVDTNSGLAAARRSVLGRASVMLPSNKFGELMQQQQVQVQQQTQNQYGQINNTIESSRNINIRTQVPQEDFSLAGKKVGLKSGSPRGANLASKNLNFIKRNR